MGDTITLYDNRYKIVGICRDRRGLGRWRRVMALREAQRLLNRPRSVSFIFVDVTDPGQAGAVRDCDRTRRFPRPGPA